MARNDARPTDDAMTNRHKLIVLSAWVAGAIIAAVVQLLTVGVLAVATGGDLNEGGELGIYWMLLTIAGLVLGGITSLVSRYPFSRRTAFIAGGVSANLLYPLAVLSTIAALALTSASLAVVWVTSRNMSNQTT
jgi:hypothetical protein